MTEQSKPKAFQFMFTRMYGIKIVRDEPLAAGDFWIYRSVKLGKWRVLFVGLVSRANARRYFAARGTST